MNTQIEPTTPAPVVAAPAPDPRIDELAGQLAAIREQNAHIVDTLDAITARGDKSRLNAKIVDFNMPFFALVGILVKIALASIPAVIILGAVLMFLAAFVGALGILGLR